MSYTFSIRPPWWRTWWAMSAYILAAILGIVSYVRWRERSLRARQKELEEKIEDATLVIRKQKEEEQLMQSRIEMEKAKAKDAFLANMSHEIRTPLNAILGFNDLLRKTRLDSEQKGHVEIIGHALKNLNVIINDILDISKLESGKLELEKRAFRIGFLVKRVMQMHLARAESKNLKLVLHFDEQIPTYIIGDETRLSQILINLVSNAIKFTSSGIVEIRAEQLKSDAEMVRIRFSVRDSGIGIDPAKLSMIFERFTQAEESTTRQYGGTGLGLNIVKSLVELHHGELYVQSKPGEGSEFTFEINFALPQEIPDESDFADKETGDSLSLGGIRVLLVEDNEHNQILGRIYLEQNGAVVQVSGNGKLAYDLLREESFDVILMDIQMPEMDGYETTRRLRQDLKLTVPVIGCSAHALESEKMKCMEAGMNDYITKPYTEQDLVNAILRRKPESNRGAVGSC